MKVSIKLFLIILLLALPISSGIYFFLKSKENRSFKELGELYCSEIHGLVQTGGYRRASEMLISRFRQPNLKGSQVSININGHPYLRVQEDLNGFHYHRCKIEGKKGVDVTLHFLSKYSSLEQLNSIFIYGLLFSLFLTFFTVLISLLSQKYISYLVNFNLRKSIGLEASLKSSFIYNIGKKWIDFKGNTFERVKSDINNLQDVIKEKSKELSEEKLTKEKLLVENEKNLEFLEHVKSVKHDLKSPMFSLNTLYQQQKWSSEENEFLARNIVSKVNSLIDQVDEIQKEYQSVKKRHFFIEDEILSTITTKQYKAENIGKSIKFHFNKRTDNKLSLVYLDDRFSRMISNLLDNSIDAIETSGDISIDIEIENQYLLISITDTGTGVNDNLLPLLFKKGATFNKPKGEGLGLYSAKKFLDKIGGGISIKSSGELTIVKISLPKCLVSSDSDLSIFNQPRKTAVLFDDELENYEYIAERANFKKIVEIHGVKEFEKVKKYYLDKKDVIFIVDENLGENLKGSELIKGMVEKSVILTNEVENIFNTEHDQDLVVLSKISVFSL